MWKKIKFKRGIISLILVAGLILANLKPLGTWAEEVISGIQQMAEGLQTEQPEEMEEGISEDEQDQTASSEAESTDESEEEPEDKASGPAITQEEVENVVKSEGVNTDKKDKFPELPDDVTYKTVKKSIKQDGKEIPEGGLISPDKDIALEATVKIRIKPAKENGPFIAPGEKITLSLGNNIRNIGESNKLEAFDEDNPGVKLADLDIKSEGEGLVTDITLVNNAQALGEGTYVLIKFKLGLKVEKTTTPGGGSSENKIWLLDKPYEVEQTEQELEMKKSGKVDWNAGQVEWLVTIKKNSKDGNNSLAGYKFSDKLKDVGEYVTGSFEVKNTAGTKVENCVPQYEDEVLTCILPDGTPNEIEVKFRTALRTDLGYSELMNGFKGVGPSGEPLINKKYNKAVLYSKDEAENYTKIEKEADAYVEGNLDWGSKYPGKYFDGKYKGNPMYESSTGQASYEGSYYKEGGFYHVDWSIIFDATDKNLSNVKITDVLPFDNQNTARLLFDGATLYVWDKAKSDWTTEPAYTFPATTMKTIFDLKAIDPKLSPLNTAVKLVIKSKVEENKVPARLRFNNKATISWNDGEPKIDNIGSDVELAEDLLKIKKRVEKDVEKVINGLGKTDHYITSNPEWTIHVDNEYIGEGNTYVYDAVIYGENIGKDQIESDANREKFTIDGGVKAINGLPLTKVLGRKLTRNVFEENSFNGNNKWGIKLKTHKLYYEGDEVGTLLEFYNFKPEKDGQGAIIKTIKDADGKEHKYTQDIVFKTKLVDRAILLGKGTNYLNSAVIHKIEDGKNKFALADFWARYSAKVIKKQAIESKMAESIISGNRKADNINIGKAANNKETAYNTNGRSILYRLSVNGSGFTTEGAEKQLHKIELRDIMPEGWKFDKIDTNNDFLIYKGKVSESNASKEAYVEAVGNPLTGAEREAVIESFDTKEINAATFKFKKLDGPYVIILKASLKDDQTSSANKYETVTNFARVYINAKSYNEMNAEAKCEVKYDRRFLKKEYGTPSDSKLKWTVKYEPSSMPEDVLKFIKEANEVKLVDTLGTGLKLLKKADGSLAYNGSSYRITEIAKDGTKTVYEDAAGLIRFLSAAILPDGNDELTMIIPANGRENTYILEYTTQLIGGAGTTFSNKVKLEAGKNKNIGETESKFKIVDASASGSVGADYTNIFIRKLNTKGETLQGANFKLTKKANGQVVGTVTTNDKGIAAFYKLYEGEYVLEELAAPTGYFTDKTKYSFKIARLAGNAGFYIDELSPKQGKVSISKDNPTNTIDFINYTPDEMRADFTILKASVDDKPLVENAGEDGLKDKLSGRLITGVEFTLTPEGSSESIKSEEGTGEYVGTYTFRNLKKGIYILRETKANDAYKLLTDSYKVKVEPTNDAGKRITVLDKNGNTLANTEIWMKQVGDTAVAFNQKKIVLYDLKLVKADLIDEKANKLKDIKNPLDGAEFALTDSDGKVVGTATTGLDPSPKGELVFKGLKAGTYTLTETKAPDGYAILMKPCKITITATIGSGGYTVTVEKLAKGGAKVIENTVVVFNDKLYDLSLIKADLIYKNAESLNQIANRLEGAKFKLQSVETNEVWYAETATQPAVKGSLVFEGIRGGKYILEEVKAPEGYAPLADKYEIGVYPNVADGYKVQITKADKNPDRVKKIGDTVVVFDEKSYDLTLIKTDLIDNAAQSLWGIKNRLDGAEFSLSWKFGNGGKASIPQETGKATGEAGTITFKGLKAGVYTLKETKAPAGYAPLNKEFEITVTPGSVNVSPEVKVTSGSSVDIRAFGNTIVLFNEKVYDLRLRKADLIDKAKIEVPGATLSAIVSRLNGARFRLISDADPTVSESEVTISGELEFKGLKKGTYTLKEEVPPQGYNRLLEEFKITVNPNAAKGSEVTIINADQGKVRFFDNVIVVFNESYGENFNIPLIKADLADKDVEGLDKFRNPLLPGARFTLSLKSSPVISQSSITLSDGKLNFTGIKAGVYILKEIEAPAGYTALMNEYEVTVTPSAVSGQRVGIKYANGEQIKRIGDTIIVFNKKNPPTPPPVTPPGPVVPIDPGTPTDPPTPPPVVPIDPGTPNVPTPNTPPTPNNPPTNVTPDPNVPSDPDDFESIDEDDTPQGKVVKSKKPKKDENIEVDEDPTPQGVKKAKKRNLPKAGGTSTLIYYAGGAILLLLAAGIVVIKKKRNNK